MKNTEMRELEIKSLCENVSNGDYVKASKRFGHIVESFIDEKLELIQRNIVEELLNKGQDDDENADEENEPETPEDKKNKLGDDKEA